LLPDSPGDGYKKGQSGFPDCPSVGTKKEKRQRYPYTIRTPLPVIVLSDYREKGKTYPISTEAFSNLLYRPAL
jgi:hypothetical protein